MIRKAGWELFVQGFDTHSSVDIRISLNVQPYLDPDKKHEHDTDMSHTTRPSQSPDLMPAERKTCEVVFKYPPHGTLTVLTLPSKPVYMDPHLHLYHIGGQINLEGTCSIPARMHSVVGLKPLLFYRPPESMLA